MALERELAIYQHELPRLLEHAGKFAVVYDGRVVDTYETYEDALKAGYQVAGLQPFLVKQILATEQALFISRQADEPCLT